MNIAIRADASIWIGSGHIMRCLVLADELRRRGHDVFFVCLPQKADLISYIQNRGYSVIVLSHCPKKIIPKSDDDYLSWLQRSVIDDAGDFITNVPKADLVITDHYAIGFDWHKIVKEHYGSKIVAIDDLIRYHDADLLIDQTLGRKTSGYKDKGCKKVLAGSQYSMLSPQFAEKREHAFEKSKCQNQPKILLTMGGIDALNATLISLRVLSLIDADISVLLSPRAPHYVEVKEWCTKYDNVTHYDFVENMAELMLEHDIAIGAPGTTSWERACLGLPSIVIPLAKNQIEICEQLVSHKAAIAITPDLIESELQTAYQALIQDWEYYRTANFHICDGRGVRRVGLMIESLLNPDDDLGIELCTATQNDIKLVFKWQIHPKTRQYALNSQAPSWKEHSAWMSRKLTNYQDYFYIIKRKTDDMELGVLRLDRLEPNNYLVSVFIEPGYYGKGIASRALSLADAIHPDFTLHAQVLSENLASQKLFEKANYQRIAPERFIRNPIL